MDVWSWGSPIGLGLFLLMLTSSVVLLGVAFWSLARAVDIFTNLPVVKRTTRRRRR
jgi:hypothetical protein